MTERIYGLDTDFRFLQTDIDLVVLTLGQGHDTLLG